MGAATHEYTVVEMPLAKPADRVQAWTELINKVAEHGWRLISVAPGAGQFASQTFAYFERPISS
jgi:hypothetical protein